MPNLSRRREQDGRAGRFESEVRSTEAQDPKFAGKKKFMCSRCRNMFEERSRTCPRCETRSMGELKQIPERHLDQARRGAIARARAGKGAKPWGE